MRLDALKALRARCLFAAVDARLRVVPFLVVLAVAFATLPIDDTRWGEAAVCGAAAVVFLAAVWFLPWRRIPALAHVLPLLLYLAIVAGLIDANGGPRSGYTPLVFLAVVWAAVFGRAVDAAIVVAATASALALPTILIGEPRYPDPELRRIVLLTLVSSIAAAVLQVLVTALLGEVDRRVDAEQRLNDVRASEIHDDIVQAVTAAQLAIAVDDRTAVDRALTQALSTAQALVGELFTAAGRAPRPGELRRKPPR